MLFRDNLVIRLVLVYRAKENLRFKYSKSLFFHFFIRHSTVSNLFPAVKSIQAHRPCVFEKTRVSGYIPLREKQKYQVTNAFLKSKIVTFAT